jgi:hypothetical protein
MDQRAEKALMFLRNLEYEYFKECAIGLLRAAVDFRECTFDQDSWVRAGAKLLPWWLAFTEGAKTVRLLVEKVKTDIKAAAEWFENTVAPLLSVLWESPSYGFDYLEKMREKGRARYRIRHHQLVGVSAST